MNNILCQVHAKLYFINRASYRDFPDTTGDIEISVK